MPNKNNTKLTAKPGELQVIIKRTFDAPRNLVFETFADPIHISQWWGPRSLENKIEKMEVRIGGIWRIIQRSPEWKTFGFHGVYHEVVSPERIVRTFEFEVVPGQVALEMVILENINGKTMMTNTAVFQSVEDRDGMISSGMESGMNESYERLDKLLENMKNHK